MKRNKKNTSKAGISPYKKHKKKSYRYSEAYYAWRSKFKKRDE